MIEELQFFTGVLFMAAQIEIGAGVYAFQFFETKRKTEFDIGSGIGVVG